MKAFEAVKIFNQMAKEPSLHNQDKPNTGCFYRAEAICEAMSSLGEANPLIVISTAPKNTWINSKIPYLVADAPKPTLSDVKWGFHVAAAAKVTDLAGKEEVLVFDTAMFEGAVPIDAWARAMSVEGRFLSGKDVDVMEYNDLGKDFIAGVKEQTGNNSIDDFFAQQPAKFADKKVLKRPSTWLKNYNKVIASSQASMTK